ncbi:MAG: hypothetical protein GX125_06565 [Bacteroidales bacterium]|nr:hypothetical protein [Bacteroidota bacterium]NLN99907.1 hypothetical protein [Bacteroidales bacterium]
MILFSCTVTRSCKIFHRRLQEMSMSGTPRPERFVQKDTLAVWLVSNRHFSPAPHPLSGGFYGLWPGGRSRLVASLRVHVAGVPDRYP